MAARALTPPRVREFLEHLEKARDRSPHTLSAYARDLEQFVDFLDRRHGGRTWSFAEVDRFAIRGFLGELEQRGLARRSAARNVTINGLLPGPFDTDRLRGTSTRMAETQGRAFDEVHRERMQEVPAKRFGTAEEFGAMTAFLCSQYGGYITGQNIVIDGGSFPGTL